MHSLIAVETPTMHSRTSHCDVQRTHPHPCSRRYSSTCKERRRRLRSPNFTSCGNWVRFYCWYGPPETHRVKSHVKALLLSSNCGVGMSKLTTSLMFLNPQGNAQGNDMGHAVSLQQRWRQWPADSPMINAWCLCVNFFAYCKAWRYYIPAKNIYAFKSYRDLRFVVWWSKTAVPKSIPTGYAIIPKWSNSASKMSEISPPVGPFCHFDALNRLWCATCTHKSMNIAHVVQCDPTGLTHWIVVIEPFDSSVDPFESNTFCAIL